MEFNIFLEFNDFICFLQIIAHLKLVAGNRVVAMVGNLGGTSVFEMNIISAEVKEQLGMLQ